MNLQKIENYVKTLPITKMLMLRPDWDKTGPKNLYDVKVNSEHGVHACHLSVNYHCLDPYSDNQRVEYRGLNITVWHHTARTVALDRTLEPGFTAEQVLAVVKKLANDVAKECTHQNSVHTKNLGNCWNEYKCRDCGLVYDIDSSG